MQRPDPIINFRQVTQHDLPLLEKWMAQPHWQEWWGETEEEIGYIIDMLDGRDTTRPFIFQVNGSDAGYIQYWRPADQLFEPWLSQAPWMMQLPEGAIGVDMSIGNADLLSKGIGSRVLSAFIAKLRDKEFTEIYIDPDPANKRAIRAYEKAGFRAISSIVDPTGDCLIMRHEEIG